jgi:hypothetical protein
MSRARQTFRQHDITRVVKGVVAAGVDVMRVNADIDGQMAWIDGECVL